MNKGKIFSIVFIFVLSLVILNLVSAVSYTTTGSSARYVSSQNYPATSSLYSSQDRNIYWPVIDSEDRCQNRQDILLQVAPAGCQPAVVRSDLLAEQNVPVFCQLDALQINPLLDIKAIDSISFSGRYPPQVISTGFHPARAALSTRDKLLNNPLINNVGYVVVVLKRQQNESGLPESVTLNLTARLRYDAYNAFGVGQASFVLPEETESQFKNSSATNTFWQGRYSLRAEEISADGANVALYYQDRRISTLRLEPGKTSPSIYIPGFATCQAALNIVYDGFERSGEDRVRVEVTDQKGTDVFDLYEGMSFANGRCRVSDVLANPDGLTGQASISCSGNPRFDISLNNIKAQKTQTPAQSQLNEAQQKAVDDYLKYAREVIKEYQTIAENYQAEFVNEQKTYGELALQEALIFIKNSGRSELNQDYSNLLSYYRQKYPNSPDLQPYTDQHDKIFQLDSAQAAAVVRVDNNYITVRALKFTTGIDKPSALISIDGKQSSSILQGTDIVPMTGTQKERVRLSLVRIEPGKISVQADCPQYYSIVRTFEIAERNSVNICGKSINVQKINTEKLGRFRIIPRVNNAETETNVTVKIGIEKRAIQLSPQKASQMISNLNKSIQKWESISTTLGKTVTGLKTACFATAAVLTAKNFVSGLDGTSLARKNAMQGKDGWSERCAESFRTKGTSGVVTSSPYISVDDCFRQNADKINADVEANERIIKKINPVIEGIEKDYKKETQPFGTIVNTEASAAGYIAHLQKDYASDHYIKDTVALLKEDSYKNGMISYSDMKELEYNALLLREQGISEGQKARAESRIAEIRKSVDVRLNDVIVAEQAKGKIGNLYPGLRVDTFIPKTGVIGEYEGIKYSTSSEIRGVSTEDNGKPIDVVTYLGGTYLLVLSEPNPSGQRNIQKAYTYDLSSGNAIPANEKLDSLRATFPIFVQKDINSYKNKYLNPQVRFFETEPYKGMPSLVPVDTADGWYAGTRQVLPVFGQQSTYQSSGRVSSFWLCNVGSDGLEEFEKSDFGEDDCQQFNFYSGQSLTKFGGLSDSQTQVLVQKAVSALTEAARQHANGVNYVTIAGQRYQVGNPSSNIPAARCQDYMSPKECLLLFNVCDPVICPSSRCNFGGQYNVANVPETGIVGSALLCLPNAKEGIALPVCLTGLQSGVDGFVSVMKSHRDCLQEQLKSGRTVGICDQIYSIYMCEFFWRQAAPVANILLPKIIEGAYGQGTRGGGEYLTVMGAWQQTQQSISYFTQQYAVNSIQAFKVRSVEEAGGEFCKAFASAKAPTSIKSLVEPDSPPQFHAWFSSIKYSDVTVPATAQYKVYYHIFAGKDTGVNYEVYLKNPTPTSFYNIPQMFRVNSGFITRGQYASDTRDFTAPEGYKQLCVRINGREECGFQQVSTSFALNYLTDQTRADALTQANVKTEQECVSGSVGSNIALSPNLQTTVESAVSPAIYNQGIIRICATQNPGSSSAPGRFIEVGYCDSKNVKCWLDKESISRALTQQGNGTQNAVLSEMEKVNKQTLTNNGVVLDDATAQGKINALKDDVSKLSSTSTTIASDSNTLRAKINGVIEEIYLNKHRAELYRLRAQVLGVFAESLKPVIKSSVATTSPTTSQPTSSTGTAVSTIIAGNFLDKESENKKSIESIVKNNKDGQLVIVRGTYNSILFSVDDKAYYIALNYNPLPLYVKENPSLTKQPSLDLLFPTEFYQANRVVGSLVKNAQGLWMLKLKDDAESKKVLGSMFELNGKLISNAIPITQSEATSAAASVEAAKASTPATDATAQAASTTQPITPSASTPVSSSITFEKLLDDYIGNPKSKTKVTVNRPWAFDVDYIFNGTHWEMFGLFGKRDGVKALTNEEFIKALIDEKKFNLGVGVTVTNPDNPEIQISASTPLASGNVVPTVTRNHQIQSIEFVVEGKAVDVSTLSMSSDITLKITHQCDPLQTNLRGSSISSPIQKRMTEMPATILVGKLSAGDYVLQAECYGNGIIKDSKTISFPIAVIEEPSPSRST